MPDGGVETTYYTYLMLTFLNGFVKGFRMRLAGDAETNTAVNIFKFFKTETRHTHS